MLRLERNYFNKYKPSQKKVKYVYAYFLLLGPHKIVGLSGKAVAKMVLSIASGGNVRTETHRLFTVMNARESSPLCLAAQEHARRDIGVLQICLSP